MSETRSNSRKSRRSKTTARKPPPRWRRYLVQAELELPPPEPASLALPVRDTDVDVDADPGEATFEPAWWQSGIVVAALGVAVAGAVVLAVMALQAAARDRALAEQAEARARTLTLRAVSTVRTVRIEPNPRSWSAAADATIAWPDPPELLELRLPVGYAQYMSYALTIDKVDHGRVLFLERVAPDSNRELRLALNSSAFGPGEYRLRIQGYTWRGERVEAGWIRLAVQ